MRMQPLTHPLCRCRLLHARKLRCGLVGNVMSDAPLVVLAQLAFSFLCRCDAVVLSMQIETMTTWGFIVRLVNSTGTACCVCPWYAKCTGCAILPSAPRGKTWRNGYIAVDWDPVSVVCPCYSDLCVLCCGLPACHVLPRRLVLYITYLSSVRTVIAPFLLLIRSL